MRWLGRLILLVVLGWFAFGAVNSLLQWQGWRTSTVLDWEQDFTAYPVFWLDGQQLLVFDIPANAEQVRVQLTPTFDSATNTANDSTAVNTSSSSEYRVHYQLFNDTGVVTDEATRHYLLDQTLEVVEPGQIPDRFFERPDGQGAQLTSGFFIDNRRGEPVRRLTLGLQQNNLAVAGVVGNVGGVAVRVSVLERKNEQDLPILWQRMHRDKRLALMAENIYPAELVSEEQRRTALQYSWLPLGPEGIEGEEYKAATLFIKKLIVTSVDEHAVFTRNHMLASPKQVFTFFQTGELTVDTLSCEALDGVPLDWLELLEQDPQNPQTLSRRIFIGADLDAPIKLEAKPVLYQIRTSALCQLRLIDQQGNPVDLPPKVQRSYLVNPESLVFALAVQGKAVQPIRLDVRGLLVNGLAVNGIGTQGGIDWQVQDKDGNNILSGNLDLLPVQDMFEALPISTNEEQLFSKHSTFILAPAAGVKLVVQSADAQALVSVFTRPLNLSYKDDFDQGSLHGKAEDILQGKSQRKAQELPQWFMLLPKGANRLKADGLTRLIYRQQRPKLPDVVEPGLSQWQALKSVDDPPTYPLFVGQSNAAKIDSVTVAANYQLIEGATVAGTEVGFSANFVVDRQAKTLSPKLVYVQPSPKVQKVQVSIDGKTFDYWLGAQAGQITLPSINVGEHHISIEGSANTRWYINHLTPKAQGHRIRSAYALEHTLTFEISKQSDKEWVTFYYFSAVAAAHTIKISLEHDYQSGEYEAHTIPGRVFLIPGAAPGVMKSTIEGQFDEGPVYLLNQDKPALPRGYLLKFPLDKDLSPGQYSLNVSSDRHNSGFVQASYVLSDVSQLLYHFVEVENAL